jgi:hypothetical protein
LDLHLLRAEQLGPGVEQEGAEDVGDPLEPPDQRDPGADERDAHRQRPHNPPEQHLVLVLRRHLEVAEDQQEDEQVVHAQRLFDHIAGHELQRSPRPVPEIDQHGEARGQRDPEGGPADRLPHPDDVRVTVEDEQVQHHHQQDEGVEGDPEEPGMVKEVHAGVDSTGCSV